MKATFSSIEYGEADIVPQILPKPSERIKRKSIHEENSLEEEDDEFYDAREQWDDASSLAKWSSMELEHADLESTPSVASAMAATASQAAKDDLVSFRRVQSLHEKGSTPVEVNQPPLSARPHLMSRPIIDVAEVNCPTQALILVVHGGSVLDGKKSTILFCRYI